METGFYVSFNFVHFGLLLPLAWVIRPRPSPGWLVFSFGWLIFSYLTLGVCLACLAWTGDIATRYPATALALIALGALPWLIWRLYEGDAAQAVKFGAMLSMVTALGVAALWVYVLDRWVAFSLSWVFTLGWIAFAALICLPAAWRYRSRLAAGLVVLFAVGLLAQHFSDLSPVKPYHRFYAEIAKGMTMDEVAALMRAEFPAGGRYHEPVMYRPPGQPDRVNFFLGTIDEDYNAEGIFLDLRDGQVVGKQYMMD